MAQLAVPGAMICAMRPALLLATMLTAGLLAAGCGGSGSGSSATSASTPAASTPAGEAAVAACRQAVGAQTSLPAATRARLEGICSKAASGGTAQVAQVAREVCEEAVRGTSTVTKGSALEQEALAACRKAGG